MQVRRFGQALQWLVPCVGRLCAKGCVREARSGFQEALCKSSGLLEQEIGFLLSLPAQKLGSALPGLGAEHLGSLLQELRDRATESVETHCGDSYGMRTWQDVPFAPQGARCRVEGSTSNAKLNGLEGAELVKPEACVPNLLHCYK